MADQAAVWLGSINLWLKDISASVGRNLGTVFAPTVTLDNNTVSLADNTVSLADNTVSLADNTVSLESDASVIIQGITDAGETIAIEVGSDGHLPTLTYSEFMIHLGRSWSVSHVNAAVAAGANFDMILNTDPHNPCHVSFSGTASGLCQMFLYEAPSISGGTHLSTRVLNRRSSISVSGITAVHSPTVNSVGRVLFNGLIPGATIAGVGGGTVNGPDYLLRLGTRYLLRLTNLTAGALACAGTFVGHIQEI